MDLILVRYPGLEFWLHFSDFPRHPHVEKIGRTYSYSHLPRTVSSGRLLDRLLLTCSVSSIVMKHCTKHCMKLVPNNKFAPKVAAPQIKHAAANDHVFSRGKVSVRHWATAAVEIIARILRMDMMSLERYAGFGEGTSSRKVQTTHPHAWLKTPRN
jgi:hypothetical protein